MSKEEVKKALELEAEFNEARRSVNWEKNRSQKNQRVR